MNFVTGLLISTNWKSDSYNWILVILYQLMKMIYYKLVKVTIDVPSLAKVIIDVVIYYYKIPESIVMD